MTDLSFKLNKLVGQPETVSEAVEFLLSILNNEQKSNIAAMKEDDLIYLHFNLGLAIRNAFKLHNLGSKLVANCGVVHPDDASGVIIKDLWSKLSNS